MKKKNDVELETGNETTIKTETDTGKERVICVRRQSVSSAETET